MCDCNQDPQMRFLMVQTMDHQHELAELDAMIIDIKDRINHLTITGVNQTTQNRLRWQLSHLRIRRRDTSNEFERLKTRYAELCLRRHLPHQFNIPSCLCVEMCSYLVSWFNNDNNNL